MKEKRLHDGQHRLPGSTIVTVFIGFLLLLVGKCCGFFFLLQLIILNEIVVSYITKFKAMINFDVAVEHACKLDVIETTFSRGNIDDDWTNRRDACVVSSSSRRESTKQVG
ncbi:hypothetical protein T12_1342 [Trichinella patagoniensis]|uniref:Uncharacterized protein n=1 Tax=Trichinella patagoniensis TaxID=990121 RepID=A0A0V0ZPM1_9BILA|nr:hypothetical protein T12_1342 [Trichinella patagoniensis]